MTSVATKTGDGEYSASDCQAVLEICDVQGNCCLTSGLDNPGITDRQRNQTDVYTNRTLLDNCSQEVSNIF